MQAMHLCIDHKLEDFDLDSAEDRAEVKLRAVNLNNWAQHRLTQVRMIQRPWAARESAISYLIVSGGCVEV